MVARMRVLLLILVLLGTARADDRKAEFASRDAARLAIAEAINKGDAAAFATYVGASLTTEKLWLDTPACRSKFSTAKIAAKQVPAFFACLSPLGMDGKTLLVRYGPDVIVRLDWAYADGKTTLVSMKGEGMTSAQYPGVWIDAFEKHRTAGDLKLAFDAAAIAEIEESDAGGAIYEVCVDAKGNVASVSPRMVAANGPTAKSLKAATKAWKFEPFLVRGKPAMACALENQSLKK